MVWQADPRPLVEAVAGWRGARVVVIGDALLDEWCYCQPERLSREAPVPVVTVDGLHRSAGGAANTAVNIAALGGRPVLVTATADDAEGQWLRECLTESGVDVRAVVVPGWRTPVKRRVVAGDHIVLRLDSGGQAALPARAAGDLDAALADAVSESCSAVAVCDYSTGVAGRSTRQWLLRQRAALPMLAIDGHELGRWRTVRPTLVTPSFAEAVHLIETSGSAAGGPADDRPRRVERIAGHVLDRAGAEVAAVTLDVDGAVVVARGRDPVRTSTLAAPASHAVGAGDAYLAAMTLAMAAGTDLAAAAALAQVAAATSIRGPRTCVSDVDAAEPETAHHLAAVDLSALLDRLHAARQRGARLVFTNGCFDVLHRGHVGFLRQARALGDLLVVGLNADESVARLKGPDRPVNHVEDRAAVLAALSCVDHVVVFEEDSPERLIRQLAPDVYVKGGDYRADLLPEAAVAREAGGEVRILDYLPDRSTSAIIERIRSQSRPVGGGGRRASG